VAGGLISPIAIGAASSLLWGSADFLGGVAAKRAPAPLVACFSGIGGMVPLVVAMPFVPGVAAGADLAWGAAAGACGAAGASLMYRSLAMGPMSLASPVFSLIGLCVPVLFGLAAGERPSALAWTGVGLAGLAIPLLSKTGAGPGHHPRAHVRRTLMVAIAAGLVIGWFLVFVAHIGRGAGLMPLVVARGAAMGLLAAWYLARRQSLLPAAAARRPALAAGALDSAANVAFMVAVHLAPLVLISALVSLAPAATVMAARPTMGERWTVAQGTGLLVALAAGLCISVG
jgi:drug/metabolite transporter (DMT)-like permease